MAVVLMHRSGRKMVRSSTADTTDWLCPSSSTKSVVFWVKHVACCSTGTVKHCWSILMRAFWPFALKFVQLPGVRSEVSRLHSNYFSSRERYSPPDSSPATRVQIFPYSPHCLCARVENPPLVSGARNTSTCCASCGTVRHSFLTHFLVPRLASCEPLLRRRIRRPRRNGTINQITHDWRVRKSDGSRFCRLAGNFATSADCRDFPAAKPSFPRAVRSNQTLPAQLSQREGTADVHEIEKNRSTKIFWGDRNMPSRQKHSCVAFLAWVILFLYFLNKYRAINYSASVRCR